MMSFLESATLTILSMGVIYAFILLFKVNRMIDIINQTLESYQKEYPTYYFESIRKRVSELELKVRELEVRK